MNPIHKKTILIMFSAVVVTSCGTSKRQALLDTIESPQTRPATFEALREDFKRADANQVNLISPERYHRAKQLFEEAQTNRAQGQSPDVYNSKLDEARRNLDFAMVFTRENKDRMAPLIEARQAALTSGATETTGPEIKNLEKRYLNLVTNLENGDSRRDAATQIPELTHAYQNFTIENLEARYLGEAKNNLLLARKENAKNLAPKTLRETESAIKKAEDYINQERGDVSAPMVTELSQEASFASRRLLVLTRQSKIYEKLSPEEISLRVEDLLNSAGDTLRSENLSDLSFEAHAAALSRSIANLQDNRQAAVAGAEQLQSDLVESKNRLSSLENKTEKYSQLEEKNETNMKYESVRELFDEKEAKVSRQGNTLTISLKEIKFPVSESEIPTSSFGLLKKVQSAIRTFDHPTIVIAGHTDSTGDSASNKLLSENRANAVKSYLLSNNVLSPESIQVTGYGSEMPLASNKSKAGRAINRRIDVIIKD